MPAARKKAWEPTHIEMASAAVLNAIRDTVMRRPRQNRSAPAAIASVAGPGPNSSAIVKRNVSSSIAMFTDSEAKFNRNDRATIASPARASQRIGSGVRTAANAASTSTNAPATTTASR